MATLLDAPRPGLKAEEFVEKQIASARSRIRGLDMLSSGLKALCGSLLLLVVALLVDRYVEAPAFVWYAVAAFWLVSVAGYAWVSLFRPSRRSINPLYVAREVERSIPSARNSIVNYVDLHEDQRIAGPIRAAIGLRAAKDIKTVEIDQAFAKKSILWLALSSGILAIGTLLVLILPPTRTKIEMVYPAGGDLTIFMGQDARFEVNLRGRVPSATDPDTARIRFWYNPDDPESFEERPLTVSEESRTRFGLILPAKQVRSGFRYRVLAGNDFTPDYTVIAKIIPEFAGFDVQYQFPEWSKRPEQLLNDPNIVAPWGTEVTLTARTNREVRSGQLLLEQPLRTIAAELDPANPEQMRFRLRIDMKKPTGYRMSWTTPEGDQNSPKRYTISVLDAEPKFTKFDIRYEYPEYTRFKPMTLTGLKDAHLEGIRGTKVLVTGHTNRPVKDAKLTLSAGTEAVVADLRVASTVSWKLMLLKDQEFTLSFVPATGEGPSLPVKYLLRATSDQIPTVNLTKPAEEEVSVAANGVLPIEGFASDDHGINKMTLRMQVRTPTGANLTLEARPYRGGMSFLRKEDNSWPTRLDYKDVLDLAKVKLNQQGAFELKEGMIVEYWLEAEDNRNIFEGPNIGISEKKRIRILPPEKKPEEQKKIDDQKKELDKEKKDHETKQDQKNANEKRDPNQPQNGNEKGPMDPMNGQGQDMDPKKDPMGGMGQDMNPKQDPMGMKDPMGKQDPMNPMKDPMGGMGEEKNAKDLEKSIDQNMNPGTPKPDMPPEKDPKNDPMGGMGKEPPAEAKPMDSGTGNKPDPMNPMNPMQKPPMKPETGDDKGMGSQKGNDPAATPKPEGDKPPEEPMAKLDPMKGPMGDDPMKKPMDPSKDPEKGMKPEKEPGTEKGDGNTEKKPEPGKDPADPMKKPEPKNPDEPKKEDGNTGGMGKPEGKDKDKGEGEQKPPAQEKPNAEGKDPTAQNKPEKPEKPEPKDGNHPKDGNQNDPGKGKESGDDKGGQNSGNKGDGKMPPDNSGKGKDKPPQELEREIGKKDNGNGEQEPPRPKTKDDVERLTKDLQNPDPKKQQEAKDKLSDAASKNPKTEEEIKDNIDELKKKSKNEKEKADLDKAKDEIGKKAEEKRNERNGGTSKKPPEKSEVAKNPPAEQKPMQGDPMGTKPEKGDPMKSEPKPMEGGEKVAQNPPAETKPEPMGGGMGKDPMKPETEPKNDPKNDPKKEVARSEPKPNEPMTKEGTGKDDQPKEGTTKEEPMKMPKEGMGNPDPMMPKEMNPASEEKPAPAKDPKADPSEPKPREGDGKDPGNTGGGTPEMKAAENLEADLKNRLKSAELQLEKFRKAKEDDEILQKIGRSKEELEKFITGREKALADLRAKLAEIEKNPKAFNNRTGTSALNGGEGIRYDPKDGPEALKGSRGVVPPQYSESYRQFTQEASGVKK